MGEPARTDTTSRQDNEAAGRAPWVYLSHRLGLQLAAYTTTGQLIQGLRYLLQGISSHAATIRQAGT